MDFSIENIFELKRISTKMTIYNPDFTFTKTERELFRLIEKILIEEEDNKGSNLRPSGGTIVVSESEALKLEILLNNLISAKTFLENTYFVERVTQREFVKEEHLREIYLYRRKKKGRTRAMASSVWSDFQFRLGIVHKLTISVGPAPMPFEYFVKMEKRLLQSMNIHPKIYHIFLKFIEENEGGVERIRSSIKNVKKGTFKRIANSIKKDLRIKNGKRLLGNTVEKTNLVSLGIIIANSSVLFTTRDWSVAGTMSCLAGAVIGLKKRKNKK